MKNFVFGFLAAAVLLTAGFFAYTMLTGGGPEGSGTPVVQRWHCPMHPTYISESPGDCPICGMKLVPLEEDSGGGQAGGGAGTGGESAGSPGPGPAVEGYATVTIPKERVQLMGITLGKARRVTLDQNIRTFGRVTFDETKVHHVHTKFDGYIDSLFVNFVGQFVEKGQPLFSIYSPELFATQNDYLIALRGHRQASEGEAPDAGGGLLGTARQRLAFWDISEADIRRLEQTRTPVRALTFRSPIRGVVTAKTALQGAKVMTGDNLYEITDLSTVWIQTDIYEVHLPFVRIGQSATISLSSYPGSTWRGRVVFLSPTVDPATRTVKARIEVPNPTGELKPDMFADVVLQGAGRVGLAVDESAVISTGERNILFVAKGGGVFEPREVTLGAKALNDYEITGGVEEGETVVTGANFLLDSESKLKSAASASLGGHVHGAGAEAPSAPADVTIVVDGKFTPDTIHGKKGQRLRIAFERHDESTCTDEVLFETFQIRRALPKHQTTVIELGPLDPGRYTFTCGMKMVTGTLVVHESR